MADVSPTSLHPYDDKLLQAMHEQTELGRKVPALFPRMATDAVRLRLLCSLFLAESMIASVRVQRFNNRLLVTQDVIVK
jgi:hypothetical protein